VGILRWLAQVGIRGLSACEQSWSAHVHIHAKVRNRLTLEATGKHAHPNMRLASTNEDTGERKLLAWGK
jgi:hypothetical protein